MADELPMVVLGDGPGVCLWRELARGAGRPVAALEDGLPDAAALVVADWPSLGEQALVARTREVAAALPSGSMLGVFTRTTPAAVLAGPGPGREITVALRLVEATTTPRLLEVVPSLATPATVLERWHAQATEVGFTTVQSPDLPGFLIDALLRPHLNLAARLLEEQVAVAADLDQAVRLGLGHPIGPIALLDRIGLAEHLAVTDALYATTGDPKYQPPTLLRRMAALGFDAPGDGSGADDGEES